MESHTGGNTVMRSRKKLQNQPYLSRAKLSSPFSANTHPHTLLPVPAVIPNHFLLLYISVLPLLSLAVQHHTNTRKCTQTPALSFIYLSRRRKWRLSPGSSPPGRCSDPCEKAEPWGCTTWTSRPPFSPPAPSAAPPAATASPSRPGNAARKVR